MVDAVYVKSSFIQVLRDADSAVIWHSLFGYPTVVSVDTLEFLESFSKPATICSRLSDELINMNRDVIEELLRCYLLVPKDFDDRSFLEERMWERETEIVSGSLIDYLELIISEECNFRCTYCIHFNNLEKSDRINNPKKFMRLETAKKGVDRYLEILRRHRKHIAEINFGGGEPLLAWPVIKNVLRYCRYTYGSEFELHFSINTNASLITPEIAVTLKEYSVEIASSLDGLQEGNDCVRLTKSGGSTFSQIMRGFEVLVQAEYPLNGIAMTLTEKNFHKLDESIIDWAIACSMKEVRIDINVVNIVEVPIKDVVAKLMRIRSYAAKRGVDVPGFWLRPAENLNESTLESRVAFCGAVRGNSMCVSPSGNIYGCGYSNIMEKLMLIKIKLSDKEYFAKWWRDKELLRLTSGILKPISDEEINKYFQDILESKIDYHFIIVVDRKTIGHISLSKRANNWHETQIVIGEKEYWGKGCGIEAIRLLIKRVKRLGILKIFLEVRSTNLRAIKVYEKCGFTTIGVRKYPKNKYLSEVLRMELRG